MAVKACRWPTRGVADLARFDAEIRDMTRLSAEGCLVPLLGSGLLRAGRAYVVMRLCAGGSIEKYLPLPVALV
ncbi:hypothetical protein AB0K00_04005 [Dactylosporangium sp. NPDC049525]|uniref:hypothetical protein n=1 Tax=Dactylosporangium sp. NPDC049525 TaxID=3154730 RepID=UPI0034149178